MDEKNENLINDQKIFNNMDSIQNLDIDSLMNEPKNETSVLDKFTEIFIEADSDYEELVNKNENNLTKIYDLKRKKKSILRALLKRYKNKEWDDYYNKIKININKKKTFKLLLKEIFNINGEFIRIWKLSFNVFHIVHIFVILLRYLLLEYDKIEYENSKRMQCFYIFICIMFTLEFVFSSLVLIFNGGSFISFLKLPIKLYDCIPFPLDKYYLSFIKFFRIDLFSRLFRTIEKFIYENFLHRLSNYYLKIFLTYTNKLFAFLFIFFYYGLLLSYFLSRFNQTEVINSLYCMIETFTTIGFGETSHKSIYSYIVAIVALYIGIDLFTTMSSNINYLNSKMILYHKETSLDEAYENIVFKLQSNTGKILSDFLKNNLRENMFNNSIRSYPIIQNKFIDVFKEISNNAKKELNKKLFDFTISEIRLNIFNNTNEFLYRILEKVYPKIYKKNKEIIKYNQEVNQLYFNTEGEICVYNANEKPVYWTNENGIFGDFEFFTGTLSIFSVKNHPRKNSFGFILKKEDWEKIAKEDSINAKLFIKSVYFKRQVHFFWETNAKYFKHRSRKITESVDLKKYKEKHKIKPEEELINKEEQNIEKKNYIPTTLQKIYGLQNSIIKLESKLIFNKKIIYSNIIK